jgi:hypothetical protein
VAVGLTVGEFSRITHLVKTLRNYHQVGLLEPAEVNPGNGYRYSVRFKSRRLRSSVACGIWRCPSQKSKRCCGPRTLRSAMPSMPLNWTALRRSCREHTAPSSHCATCRSVAPIPAVGIQQMVDGGDLLPWWQGALGELHATVRAEPARFGSEWRALRERVVTGPRRGDRLHPGRRRGAIDRACGPLRRPGRRTGRALTYADIIYGELGAYATTHEISVEGPLREYYVVDSNDTPTPEDWVTEIGWPIFRSDNGH